MKRLITMILLSVAVTACAPRRTHSAAQLLQQLKSNPIGIAANKTIKIAGMMVDSGMKAQYETKWISTTYADGGRYGYFAKTTGREITTRKVYPYFVLTEPNFNGAIVAYFQPNKAREASIAKNGDAVLIYCRFDRITENLIILDRCRLLSPKR